MNQAITRANNSTEGLKLPMRINSNVNGESSSPDIHSYNSIDNYNNDRSNGVISSYQVSLSSKRYL